MPWNRIAAFCADAADGRARASTTAPNTDDFMPASSDGRQQGGCRRLECRLMRHGAAVLTLLCFLASGDVRAQEPAPRVEAGADVSSFQVPYWPKDIGAGGHA